MSPVESQAEKAAFTFTYNISSNGAAGDWYWEVTRRGEIITRGLATTVTLARADAMRAALSHINPWPENLPLEDPWASSPRIRAA